MKRYLLDTNICVRFMRQKFGVDEHIEKVGCSIAAVSFSSIFYILFSGAAGLLVYAVQQLRKGEKKP